LRRVAVIGNAAGGKSTLARALAAAYGLPYHDLDRLAGRYGRGLSVDGRAALDTEFRQRHKALITEPAWVIDGIGLRATILPRLTAADTIVHVDLPPWINYLWAARRAFSQSDPASEAWTADDLAWICRFIWHYHSNMRPRLLPELKRLAKTRRVVALKSRPAIDKFLARERAKAAKA